ncbi:MAG: thiosulfohydrolase SoxB [Rhodospirillaceae bacterium]|nr:thiosulfohydrolase SoxB [Rhodospirillaceae bacterium]MBT3910862.1 thiosulfohydrolase SoxB [Rhodospirillaceae bacterium]MBT5299660.1 thiosulfohydrolase SoxB [Rhodospirillaceae bacterium]MBT5513940.1 thiosulfohydrolase SoxB [Rhodospirillaceae bacterium]MBT6085073.1 thiosulfohydrolase SoxB [Rhodospirillaceae bacterium]
MLDRRQFMQVAAATAVLTGTPGKLSRAAARQTITQDDLLKFDAKGQVTLLNFTDCHAQLVPLYFREPSINLGVGAQHGLPPHITGKDFLTKFGLHAGSAEAYAMTSEDFSALAGSYGRIGGMDRMTTLVKAIRAQRPNNTLLLDGGDTWQGSYTALKTSGEDMVEVMNALGVEAMTAHWEFTYGEERVLDLKSKLDFPFLAGNVVDTEWEEAVFEHTKYFERDGVKIAVIGQAFPYTPVANPRYMIPNWSFGIREALVQKRVDAANAAGADLVVLLSHNGFDVDRKLAARVSGIDVILTGHTHDAIPAAIKVKDTLLVASGSHGKFLARLDLDVKGRKVVDYEFRLIPVFADAITPDPDMAGIISKIRAPHAQEIDRVLGKTDSLLYRRGNFNGTFDDLICAALLEERDAEIALSPGFRWGGSLLPGQDITVEDVFHHTALTYPNAYRSEFTGKFLKEILEDVADNLFNPDPYYQQGGDMVRVGGMAYAIDIAKPIGKRISNMTLTKSGEAIDPAKSYVVSGWASVNPDTKGPPIYDVVSNYISKKKVITVPENRNIQIKGA